RDDLVTGVQTCALPILKPLPTVDARPGGTAVLKVPHHGAKGSLYEPFLRAVHPQLAVVSVGHANAYGHPSPTMMEAYARLGIPRSEERRVGKTRTPAWR